MKLTSILFFILSTGFTGATITQWETFSQGISSNITSSTNGGSGWVLDGSAGVVYDYGNLNDDGNPDTIGAGGAIEYIFNLSDTGGAVALGNYTGWRTEQTNLRLEQWQNQGTFGITIPGSGDWKFNGAPSIFDTDTHVLFNGRTDGEMEIFVNGTSQGIATRGSWILNGGSGYIGANNGGGAPSTGTFYGVASYDTALTSQQISGLFAAYSAPVPEPSSASLLTLGSLCLLLRRKK
ncbi:PEP-CTERM sorting domain-containing protein [Verrucomicrobiaceae bacterium N1E253]|uniref:PEP-CTERM sorting domain-containing protein n=1 Tax=Oceaniferula marina TaxID=2748318 RepID=A0A851GH73_9BACT|nr:LamG-like jellyroll fold domain-containing protein [Oceaniferula marina]NWK57138.1 PEP-CTERM sorting domain-containing protein [Oceaniferula marina]